jgi:hypothetical protein
VTRRQGLAVVLALSAIVAPAIASGSDVYVVRFNTSGAPIPIPPCGGMVYQDALVFYNSGDSDASITLLGVSNGVAADPQSLVVSARQTRSSQGDSVATGSWAPDPQPALWVAHLNVPDQMQIKSRLLVLEGQPPSCNGFPGPYARVYAGISMPVITHLTPPNIPQVLLGTDIGGNVAETADDGRINVGVYNGGSIPASAVVEVRRACDGGLVANRSAMIMPNTIEQLGGLTSVFTGCSALQAGGYESYVLVTVDQPSFSYAITLSNHRLPLTPIGSAP